MDQPHPLGCARRVRQQALAAIDTAPTVEDLRAIAERIHAHCGHSPVKSHRLAHGWTVNEALTRCRGLAVAHRDDYGTLTLAERSWKGWEAGDRPSPTHQDLLCRLFHTGPVQLGFAHDYTPPTTAARSTRLRDADEAAPLSPHLLDRDVRTAIRRIRQIADSAVHETTLDWLEADIRRLARHYVSRPLTTLYGEIRELRVEALELIEVNRHPECARRLHLAAARLCGLQAHVCLDLGHYDLADASARAAWTLARTADDDETLAWIRAFQSLVGFWDGRLTDAVDAAEDGLIYATDTTTARLYALKARASAAMGQQRTVLNAIAAAHDAPPTPGPDPGQLGGVFAFPHAKCHAYTGTALLSLRQRRMATRAVSHAEHAIALYQASDPLDRSSGDLLAARLDLARAHTANRDLDGAREHLASVLTVAPAARTASIIKRATELEHALAAPDFRNTGLARTMRGDLREFCAHPAQITPEPPQ